MYHNKNILAISESVNTLRNGGKMIVVILHNSEENINCLIAKVSGDQQLKFLLVHISHEVK